MNTKTEIDRLNQVTGEFTRIMILYWDMLGRPPMSEFLTLLPMEPALEHINKSSDYVQSVKRNEYMM